MDTGVSLHIGVWSPADCQKLKELKGPKVDPSEMSTIAAQAGFTVSEVILGPDANWEKDVRPRIANAAGILSGGGTFLLTFSGHGTNKDRDIQTWCLAEKEVTETDIFAELVQFGPKVRVLVVSASCYSGGITGSLLELWKHLLRFLGFARVKGLRDDRAEELAREEVMKALRAPVLVIAACRAGETARDGEPLSLFTRAMKEVWAGGAFHGGYKLFIEAISEIVQKEKHDQRPKLIPRGVSHNWDTEPPFSRTPL